MNREEWVEEKGGSDGQHRQWPLTDGIGERESENENGPSHELIIAIRHIEQAQAEQHRENDTLVSNGSCGVCVLGLK